MGTNIRTPLMIGVSEGGHFTTLLRISSPIAADQLLHPSLGTDTAVAHRCVSHNVAPLSWNSYIT